MGRGILEAIKAGQATPAEQRPKPPPRHERISGLGPVVDLLKVLLKAKCESHGVAQKLIASAADLELIARRRQGRGAGAQRLGGARSSAPMP